MNTIDLDYVTISWKDKATKILKEEKVSGLTKARTFKDTLFHNYKQNKMLPNVWIENHILIRRKTKTYVVDYRETWALSKEEPMIEVNPHLNGAICPYHKVKYATQVGRRGLEIIYGVCDQCLNEPSTT